MFLFAIARVYSYNRIDGLQRHAIMKFLIISLFVTWRSVSLGATIPFNSCPFNTMDISISIFRKLLFISIDISSKYMRSVCQDKVNQSVGRQGAEAASTQVRSKLTSGGQIDRLLHISGFRLGHPGHTIEKRSGFLSLINLPFFYFTKESFRPY